MDGRPLDLTPLEFQLLHALAVHPGWVHSAEELLLEVWGDRCFDARVVSVHISNLRRKLEPDPLRPRYVVTVRGVGYRLEIEAAESGELERHENPPGKLRSPRQQEVLNAGAVIGEAFDIHRLARLLGESARALLGLIDELLAQGALVLGEKVGEYRFSSPRVHEEVYQAVPRARRVGLHRAMAQLLLAEKSYRDGELECLNTLAGHFLEALPLAEPEWILLHAGGLASAYHDRYEYDRATALLERALDAAGPAGALGRVELELALALYEQKGDAHRAACAWDQAVTAYRRALQIEVRLGEFQTLGAPVRTARLHRKIGCCHEAGRQFARALEALAEAETVLGPAPSAAAGVRGRRSAAWWEEWIEIRLARMWTAYYEGALDQLSELVAETTAQIQTHGSPRQLARFYNQLLTELCLRDRYRISPQALTYAHSLYEALQGAEAPEDEIAFARFVLGFCYLWADRPSDAELWMSSSLSVALERRDLALQARILTYLGVVYRFRRDSVTAAWYAHRTMTAAVGSGLKEYVSAAHAQLAWVALAQGNPGGAQAKAREALDGWAAQPTVYPFQWLALWPLIELARREGEFQLAAAYLEQLLAPPQQLPPPELQARAERAREAANASDRAALEEGLRRACDLARELGYL